jgi:hypothetical protein
VSHPAAGLHDVLARYAGGLDRQIALLTRLRSAAVAQHCATEGNDGAALTLALDERATLAAALDVIETDLRPLRQHLADAAAALRGQAAFEAIRAAHRDAERLVSDILEHDRDTRQIIDRAGAVRREAAQSIETAEATLAAYRRVLAPDQANAGLVDRQG